MTKRMNRGKHDIKVIIFMILLHQISTNQLGWISRDQLFVVTQYWFIYTKLLGHWIKKDKTKQKKKP